MGCNQSIIGPDRPCLILQGHGEDYVAIPTIGKTLLMTIIRPTPEMRIHALEVYIAGEEKVFRVFGDKGECELEKARFLGLWDHYRPSFTQVSTDPVKFIWLQGECHQGGMWIPFQGQRLLHVFWQGNTPDRGTLSVFLEGCKKPYRLENLPRCAFFVREVKRFQRVWEALENVTQNSDMGGEKRRQGFVWFQGYNRGRWVPRGPSLALRLEHDEGEEPRVVISGARKPVVFRMESLDFAALEADRFMKELFPQARV